MFKCCCESDLQKEQVVFNPNAEQTSYGFDANNEAQNDECLFVAGSAPAAVKAMDEKEAAATPGDSAAGASNEAGPRAGGTGEAAPEASAIEASEAKPSTEEHDRLEEKARLQELVKNFAVRATRGLACEAVDASTGQRREVSLFLENGLSQLTFKTQGEDDEVCSILTLKDIFRADFDAGRLDGSPLAGLDTALKSRMVVLEHSGGRSCVLEKSPTEADTVLSSMRVLRLYCDQQVSKNS